MNIQSVKQLVWLAAIALAGWLGYEVWDFSRNKEIYQRYVDSKRVERALHESVKKTEESKPRPTVLVSNLNNGFYKLNWTGKRTVVAEVTTVKNPDPVEKPKIKVSDLLTITMIATISKETRAFAAVDFLNPALAQAMPALSDQILFVGERLKGKHTDVQVEAIEALGVRFKFDDEKREAEFVPFTPYGKGGIRISHAEASSLKPAHNALAQAQASDVISYRRPERTTQTRRNHFLIGTESLAEVNRDYTRILSNDIRYRSARNRSNHKAQGLEIIDVKPGSIPDEAGLSPGEILISVNGHQVTTESDLILFIKRESKNTSEWEAVFELNGKQFTRMYTSPDN